MITEPGVDRRAALVTGGARGIGRAVADRLAQSGMAIGLCDIRADLVREAAAAMRAAGAAAIALECDVSDASSVARTIADFDAHYGRLDVIVNSAGLLESAEERSLAIEEVSLDTWSRILAVNLTGAFLVCRAGIPVMKRARWGRIVNIASRAARTNAGPVAYSASKGGLVAMSRVLAGDLGRFGITVNCVAPSRVATELTASMSSPEIIASKLAETPVGRLAQVADVAAAVAYLASDDAGFVTGAIIDVSGGSFMPS